MSYIKIRTEKVGLRFVSRDHRKKLKLVTNFLSTDISWNGAYNKKRLFPTASFIFHKAISHV